MGVPMAGVPGVGVPAGVTAGVVIVIVVHYIIQHKLIGRENEKQAVRFAYASIDSNAIATGKAGSAVFLIGRTVYQLSLLSPLLPPLPRSFPPLPLPFPRPPPLPSEFLLTVLLGPPGSGKTSITEDFCEAKIDEAFIIKAKCQGEPFNHCQSFDTTLLL